MATLKISDLSVGDWVRVINQFDAQIDGYHSGSGSLSLKTRQGNLVHYRLEDIHYTYDAMNSGVGVDALLMYNGHLYTSECLAPTQSLLQRWLGEEKGIIIELKYSEDTECFRPFWSWQIYNTLGITLEIGEPNTTYELALEDALKYALNLV